jgi:hypothetical protein
MTFNRKIWQNWSTKKPCPFCEIGTLETPKKGGFLKTETGVSKEMNSYGGYSYSEYLFSIHLKCNNCNETVAVSGFMSEENYPDEENQIRRSITPIIFYPALKIIHIPASCPKSVSKILNESFGLYWLDLGSCANKIRIAIEILLNELLIPKTRIKSKGETPLTLHTRLENFKKLNPVVSKHLMAIKWIGNAGSHFFDIKSDDVLDAFELLEFSLEKLYNDREKRLLELSEEINLSKRPRKKQ